MKDKFSKIIPFYFLLSGLAALATAFYAFSIPNNEGSQILFGVSIRYFLVLFVALFLLIIASFMGIQAYYSWRKLSKVATRLEFFLSEKNHAWVIFWTCILVLGVVTWINTFPAQIPIPSVVFVRIQPVLLWMAFVAVETLFYLNRLFPFSYPYILAELIAFVFLVILLNVVQKFLFPLEEYWKPLAIGLFFYAIFDVILVTSGRVKNFFSALDNERVGISEMLWFIVGPAAFAFFMVMIGAGKLIFLLPVVWFACSTQIFLASTLTKALNRDALPEKNSVSIRTLLWTVSVALTLWFYYLALISLNTYNRYYPGLLPLEAYSRQNPLLQGASTARGVWYAIPVEKTELYPLGYARFEDSVIDDIGHPFFGVLGSVLGFMQPCESPFLNLANSVPMPGTNSIQPSFENTFSMLCPEWIGTLPLFYSRIALLGLFLTAVIFGILIWRDPITFFVISLVLLKAWLSWPPSSIVRPGQVEFVLLGLPFVVLFPYIFRHTRTSTILVYCLACGLIAGIAGFVRQPAGLALLVTSAFAILFLGGFRHKRILIAISALIALLAGNQIMPTMVQGLFWYRDAKLEIAAPRISIASHGSGWNPLGGIGGVYIGHIVYPNALDMTHWDPILQLNGYNENPLIEFAINKLSPGMEISTDLLLAYIRDHPVQFVVITSEKTYQALNLMTDIPVNWLPVSYLLAMLGSLSILLKHLLTSKTYPSQDHVFQPDASEALLLGLMLAMVAAVPAIVTDPSYSQSIYPAAAVLFMITLIAFYDILFRRGRFAL